MKKALTCLKKSFWGGDVTVKPPAEPSENSQNQNKASGSSTTATAENHKETVEDESRGSFHTRRGHREMKTRPNCRLFLGGLPFEITETDVKKVFEQYGKVTDVVIVVDKKTKKPKGYGFLEYKDEDSVKTCLSEHFLFVNGKRVEVKRAWPQGRKEEEEEENCEAKDTKQIRHSETASVSPRDDESTTESSLGSSCTDHASSMNNSQLMCQKLFEDYFKAKFLLQNLLDSKNPAFMSEDTKGQEKDNKAELEELLSGLYVSTEQKGSDFSSDFDGSDLSDSELESSISENEAIRPGHMESTQQTNGKLNCNPCKWAPSSNSTEDFFTHFETSAHRQRLKERFKKGELPNREQNKTCNQMNSKKSTQSNSQSNCSGDIKKRSVHHPDKSRFRNEGNQKTKTREKALLEWILTSVKADPSKGISCKICNKTIPHAPDIGVLMNNLSHHLQSKGHLKKIHDFENSLKGGTCVEGKKRADCEVKKRSKYKPPQKEKELVPSNPKNSQYNKILATAKDFSGSKASNKNIGKPK